MPAPRRAFSAPLLTALLLTGLTGLAGCGDDDPEAAAETTAEATSTPSESGSAGTTPLPAPSAAAEPERDDRVRLPTAPKAQNTPAGRRAFARFVVERWGYALATNRADAVADLGPKAGACQGCKDLAAELSKRRRQGWSVDFPGAEVDRVTVRPAGTPATYRATAVVDIPASRSYFDDGTYRNDNAAHKNADFEVQMRWARGRYVLVSYTLA